MLRRMRVTMLLADAAQVSDGKLYILGGGWNMTGPPAPSAIALHIEVPWDQANARHEWSLALVDSDGDAITAPDPYGNAQPIALSGEFRVGRPADLRPGAAIPIALALSLPPLPLAPDRRYEWRLTIGPESREEWRLAFGTRAGWGA
jgi:hypothetical protein